MSGAPVWLVGPIGLPAADWWALFFHFLLLSLLAVGGAITTAPDMQRYVTAERGWLSDAEFAGSVALAQAAPGPNVLFVAVVGFNIGGLVGALVTLVGTLLPSTLLTLQAARWQARYALTRGVRAFNAGMAPVSLGLLLATGFILLEPAVDLAAGPAFVWRAPLLAGAAIVWMVWRGGSPLVPIAVGAILGAVGGLR